MKQPLSTALTFVICVFLLAEGVWGLFSPTVFGILTTNRAHALVHLVLGGSGLIAWRTGHRKSYFGFLGSLLFVGSVLWFLPATRALPHDLLNVNGAVAAVNFFLSLLALTIAVTETSRRRFGVPGSSTNPPMRVPGKSRKAA
jgi:hypothetical protein